MRDKVPFLRLGLPFRPIFYRANGQLEPSMCDVLNSFGFLSPHLCPHNLLYMMLVHKLGLFVNSPHLCERHKWKSTAELAPPPFPPPILCGAIVGFLNDSRPLSSLSLSFLQVKWGHPKFDSDWVRLMPWFEKWLYLNWNLQESYWTDWCSKIIHYDLLVYFKSGFALNCVSMLYPTLSGQQQCSLWVSYFTSLWIWEVCLAHCRWKDLLPPSPHFAFAPSFLFLSPTLQAAFCKARRGITLH